VRAALAGVVNLNVKPSNLMRAEGRITLLDFGLSQHAQLRDLMEEEFRLRDACGCTREAATFSFPPALMDLRQQGLNRCDRFNEASSSSSSAQALPLAAIQPETARFLAAD